MDSTTVRANSESITKSARLFNLFPTLPESRETEAHTIYREVFGDLSLTAWQRQGTLITRFVNGKKLNFAARRKHCTIGFQGHDAIEFYRMSGGECPVGEVTIKIYYDQAWKPASVQETIDWYFHN